MYCHNNSRPSVDPVVLFKMVMIQHLFGIASLRKTADDVRLNIAYRWFLGYSIKVIYDGRTPVLPYKRKGFYRPREYVYDEYYDCVLCPQNQILKYSTTNREGCKEFKSKGYICENCPNLSKCTNNAKCEKTVVILIHYHLIDKIL